VIAGLSKYLSDERGATSIEYALIAGFVALSIIVSATALGTRLSSEFTEVSSTLK